MTKNYFFIFILLFSSLALSTEIDYDISNRYNKVFNQKILSPEDTELYQKIFTLQKKCEFKKSNKYILDLRNEILMGNVLAQRYLHPKCYRSKFLELSSWLKMYNDHPQARRMHRLAIRRMPDGYKRPPNPIPTIGIKNNSDKIIKKQKKYQSEIILTKKQRKEKYQLLINIKSRVNKGWPTGSLKLLNQKNVKILLDSVEIDMQKELIAKGYFLAGKDKLVIKYAEEAIKRSPEHVPFANWTAGLAAWRLNDFNKAANFFSDFSISMKNNAWHESSGAFWTARSFGELGQYEKINYWLNIASKNPQTFYGQLANNILGTNNPIDWGIDKIDFNKEDVFVNLPAAKRVLALIQVGNINDAENEIIKMNNSLNEEIALFSLDLASKFNLAKTQLKIANKLTVIEKKIPLKYFYPTPNWIKLSNNKISKALILAFAHQESTFNKDAKSRKGALGLMQIMPSTAKFIIKNKKLKRNYIDILKEPSVNIKVGEEYIDYLLNLKIVDNNLIFMAAAYNGGPGNLKKWLKETKFNNDSLLFMESIPSRETRWFMEKVLTNYWIYENKFNQKSQSLIELARGGDPIYLM